MNQGVYLARYLEPLAEWLAAPDVTDIWLNRPGEIWIERRSGAIERHAAPELTDLAVGRLARQIAAYAHQGVSRENPVVSASLPDGNRVQIIGPPVARPGHVLAVRKHALSDMSLADLAAEGAFEAPSAHRRSGAEIERLEALLAEGRIADFLQAAVALRMTMVLSGGTSSGKTTLLNALLKEVGEHERLIAIEDAEEIRLSQPNSVGLIAARGAEGEARIEVEDLVQAAMRLRPDRIILGELRGKEAFAYLRAVNTGHPGSITTVHAETREGALDQIALLALLSGVDMSFEALKAYAGRVIDVIVQMERVGRTRRVTGVWMLKQNRFWPTEATS